LKKAASNFNFSNRHSSLSSSYLQGLVFHIIKSSNWIAIGSNRTSKLDVDAAQVPCAAVHADGGSQTNRDLFQIIKCRVSRVQALGL